MKKAITQDTVDLVIERRQGGTPASKLPEELGLPSSTVNVILSANGLTKARPEIAARDLERLNSWLSNGSGSDEPVVEESTDDETTDDPFAGLTVKQLRAGAKEAGVKGYSRMNREQLITSLDPVAQAV